MNRAADDPDQCPIHDDAISDNVIASLAPRRAAAMGWAPFESTRLKVTGTGNRVLIWRASTFSTLPPNLEGAPGNVRAGARALALAHRWESDPSIRRGFLRYPGAQRE